MLLAETSKLSGGEGQSKQAASDDLPCPSSVLDVQNDWQWLGNGRKEQLPRYASHSRMFVLLPGAAAPQTQDPLVHVQPTAPQACYWQLKEQACQATFRQLPPDMQHHKGGWPRFWGTPAAWGRSVCRHVEAD